jgi:hypothetical protein
LAFSPDSLRIRGRSHETTQTPARPEYGAKAPAPPVVKGSYAENIPFPAGLAPTPKPIAPSPKPDDALPQADVIAMMDTTAESAAMADVLTPGHRSTTWYPYAKNFTAEFLPQIGPSGPSRESQGSAAIS